MYEEASFRPASCSLQSMESVRRSQSRRVGDEPTVLRRVLGRKEAPPRYFRAALPQAEEPVPESHPPQANHDSTLAVFAFSESQCAREHSTDIPDEYMLLLPPPPSMSCWHSMPVRVDENRRAVKGEWHAMLAQCAAPSKTTKEKTINEPSVPAP